MSGLKDEMSKIGRRYAARYSTARLLAALASCGSPLWVPCGEGERRTRQSAVSAPPPREALAAGRGWTPQSTPPSPLRQGSNAQTPHTHCTYIAHDPSGRLVPRAPARPLWPPTPAGAPTPSLPWDGGWVVEIRHRRGGGGRSCRQWVHRRVFAVCSAGFREVRSPSSPAESEGAVTRH